MATRGAAGRPQAPRAGNSLRMTCLPTIEVCGRSPWSTTPVGIHPHPRGPQHDRGALTIQIERDFAPAWAVTATRCTVGGRGGQDALLRQRTPGRRLRLAHRRQSRPAVRARSPSRRSRRAATGSPGTTRSRRPPPTRPSRCSPIRLPTSTLQRSTTHVVTRSLRRGSSEYYPIVAGGMRVPVSNFVLPAFFNPLDTGPTTISASSQSRSRWPRVATPSSSVPRRPRERDAHRFEVHLRQGDARLETASEAGRWERTYWRLALNP